MSRFASVLVLVALFLTACGEESPKEPAPNPGPEPPAEAEDSDVLAPGRLLVRTANLEIEVKDLQAARLAIEKLARSSGGYLEFSQMGGPSATGPSRLVVRVPAATLDAVLAEVRSLAVEVVWEITAVEDVTSKSVDLDARRAALAATETELTALLKDVREGEGTAASIMSVYRELTDIRSRIERLDGERKALAEMVSLAKVEISIWADSSARARASRWAPLAFAEDCLGILVQILKFLGYAVIFLVVVCLPITLMVVIPIKVIRKLRRRSRRNEPEAHLSSSRG